MVDRTVTPLYRARMARQAAEVDKFDEPLHIAQLFHRVFGTPEGTVALDYICTVLCNIDEPIVTLDPMAVVDSNSRRSVGVAIAKLALADYDASKPTVKA